MQYNIAACLPLFKSNKYDLNQENLLLKCVLFLSGYLLTSFNKISGFNRLEERKKKTPESWQLHLQGNIFDYNVNILEGKMKHFLIKDSPVPNKLQTASQTILYGTPLRLHRPAGKL